MKVRLDGDTSGATLDAQEVSEWNGATIPVVTAQAFSDYVTASDYLTGYVIEGVVLDDRRERRDGTTFPMSMLMWRDTEDGDSDEWYALDSDVDTKLYRLSGWTFVPAE